MMNLPHMSQSGSLKSEASSLGALKVIKLIPSLLGIVVCILVIIFVIWPKFNEVMKLRSENIELDKRVGALQEKTKLLSGFSQSKLEGNFINAEKLMPSDKAVFSMVSQVEKAASASGVILNKLDLVPGAASEQSSAVESGTVSSSGAQGEISTLGVNTPRIQIKVSITSDYLSVLRFLDILVFSSRAVAITDLSVASNSTGGGGGSLRSSMVVNAFWKPLPKELPAIEASVQDISPEEEKLLKGIAESLDATASADVPKVPLGRPDLFSPF